MTITYLMQSENGGPVKIGKSKAQNLKMRLHDFNIARPDDLVILGVVDGDRESEFHNRFAGSWIKREWFRNHSDIYDAFEITRPALTDNQISNRQGCVDLIKAMSEAGYSMRAIANQLDGLGILTFGRSEKWSYSSIQRILGRESTNIAPNERR